MGRPLGSERSRHLVRSGVGIILAGVVVAAVAMSRLQHLAWLWLPAGILIVIGTIVLAVGGPSSTSRVADRSH